MNLRPVDSINKFKDNKEWLMPETILLMLHEQPELKSLDILIKNDQPYYERIITNDILSEQSFHITIRGVLMGKDDGNDTLIHFSDYMTKMMKDRSDRFSGYRSNN